MTSRSSLALCLGCIVLLLATSCPTQENPPRIVKFQTDEAAEFDWETQRPVDLLNLLRTTRQLTVMRPHLNWVRESDVPTLISLLDSQEPCGSVNLAVSSSIQPDSTIGDEAAYLIYGFRAGSYPPTLGSKNPPFSKAMLRSWWDQQDHNP